MKKAQLYNFILFTLFFIAATFLVLDKVSAGKTALLNPAPVTDLSAADEAELIEHLDELQSWDLIENMELLQNMELLENVDLKSPSVKGS